MTSRSGYLDVDTYDDTRPSGDGQLRGLAPARPLTPVEVRCARRVVAGNSHDATDCLLLFDVLDLLDP